MQGGNCIFTGWKCVMCGDGDGDGDGDNKRLHLFVNIITKRNKSLRIKLSRTHDSGDFPILAIQLHKIPSPGFMSSSLRRRLCEIELILKHFNIGSMMVYLN